MPKIRYFTFPITITKNGELHIAAANLEDAIEIVQEMAKSELDNAAKGPWDYDITVFHPSDEDADPIVDI